MNEPELTTPPLSGGYGLKSVGDILLEQKTDVETVLNEVLQVTPFGQISSVIGDNFFGINHMQVPPAIQANMDFYGHTFFTRPYLRLSSDNLRKERLLSPLLSKQEHSLQRIIRLTLDSAMSGGRFINPEDVNVKCDFVDPAQAFIPVLTNTLLSMTGWPDMDVQTFTSANGVMNESYSFIDNVSKNFSVFELTANFRNIPGDPVTAMIATWIHYAASVYLNVMQPYPDSVTNNAIDYNTRIYRLVMDPSKRYVQKIAACGAAFPVSVPYSSAFNFSSEKPRNEENDQISVNFRCSGAIYNDPILIYEFNRTTMRFNPMMRDKMRDQMMVKIPEQALTVFNNRGYPRINPNTYELEWYVSAELFKAMLPIYSRKLDPINNIMKGK